MKYHFKVQKEKEGFSAVCVELKSCHTQGKNLEELKANMHEALNLHLSEPEDSTVVFPLPKRMAGKNIVEVDVEPGVALAMLIRQTRLKKNMTQHQMKDMLGIKNLSNYQRLEDPKRANPELKTLAHILKALPEVNPSEVFPRGTKAQTKKRAG